eukprot:2855275-Rhodomonas_salina.4
MLTLHKTRSTAIVSSGIGSLAVSTFHPSRVQGKGERFEGGTGGLRLSGLSSEGFGHSFGTVLGSGLRL